MENSELLVSQAYDEGVVSEVIRPAAVVPEESARAILVELALQDVLNGGVWQSEPSMWSRYDRPWNGQGGPGDDDSRAAQRHAGCPDGDAGTQQEGDAAAQRHAGHEQAEKAPGW